MLKKIWSRQPGKYFCLVSTTGIGKRWREKRHWFTRAEFDKAKRLILKLRSTHHLFFCPHGFSRRRRTTEASVLGHWLYSDIDNGSLDIVKPTIALETSPGRHAGFWYVGEEVAPSLNQALTQRIGGDAGGWDLTQLLRAPGSYNRKYNDNPHVSVVWSNGPTYKLADLKLSPAAATTKPDLYQKWERKLPPFVRKTLMTEAKPGQRSEILWKMNAQMLEAGIPSHIIFKLIRNTSWNKFTTDEQLKKELARAVGKKLKKPTTEPLVAANLASVKVEKFDWLWQPYFARRELTIVEGDPGVGKSWLIEIIAAHLATGRQLPDAEALPPQKVLFFDNENDPGTVMKQRLLWNGFKDLSNFFQVDRIVSMGQDYELVTDLVKNVAPDLIVFDVMSNYLGVGDSHNAVESTQMLQRFRQLARDFNCSVVVLRHLRKGTADKAIYAGQGSIAFTGTARVVLSVGYSDRDQDERLFIVSKTNIAGYTPARSFTLTTQGKKCLLKFSDIVHCSAEDVVNAKRKLPEEDEDLVDWLRDQLTEPRKLSDLLRGCSYTEVALRRALTKMGAKERRGLVTVK